MYNMHMTCIILWDILWISTFIGRLEDYLRNYFLNKGFPGGWLKPVTHEWKSESHYYFYSLLLLNYDIFYKRIHITYIYQITNDSKRTIAIFLRLAGETCFRQ